MAQIALMMTAWQVHEVFPLPSSFLQIWFTAACSAEKPSPVFTPFVERRGLCQGNGLWDLTVFQIVFIDQISLKPRFLLISELLFTSTHFNNL
jgi:hypothetical protein